MKRFVTLLLLIAPVLLFAQDKDKKKKKKEKLTPQQMAANYLHDVQVQKGFDTIVVATYSMAGKEDGYPDMTKEFVVNVTKTPGVHPTLTAIVQE